MTYSVEEKAALKQARWAARRHELGKYLQDDRLSRMMVATREVTENPGKGKVDGQASTHLWLGWGKQLASLGFCYSVPICLSPFVFIFDLY